MNFVSYPQLARDVSEWVKDLPRFDAVAGVARSGMLPAVMIAKHWNVPAFSVATGIDLCRSGKGKILIVDDSLNFGGTMRATREIISAIKRDHCFGFAAVYAADEAGAAKVDYHFRIVPQPRIFEWNVFHHDILAESCVDMDGVICEDVPPGCNDDGPRYAEFLRSARPWHIPSVKVGAIVTGRLEKYRPQTVEWLTRHGVKYDRLIMMPFQEPQERRAFGIERFKAEVFSDEKYKLFIENEDKQAIMISVKTGKPVLHVNPMEWRLL